MNVTNKDPTVCVNDVLHQLNDLEPRSQPNDLEPRSQPEPFTVEELIARSVSVLEQLIEKFETQDRHLVLEQYYKYWLHRQVNVMSVIIIIIIIIIITDDHTGLRQELTSPEQIM